MRSTRRRAMLSSISALPFEWVKYLCNKIKTIFNTVELPIKEFTFYGDSVQSGTPTPESPVPIVSIVNPQAEVAPLTRVDLDPDLELRGLPQLDANNNLYYDGDEYESDGTVTRKYGIVDLGTLTWERIASTVIANVYYFRTAISDAKKTTGICSKYIRTTSDKSGQQGLTEDKVWNFSTSNFLVRDDSYTDATTFTTAMSGVYLVYELQTPTTESADPYITPVAVNPLGTEEFVDTRDVPIPVGHETLYTDGETTVTDKVPYLFRRVPAGNKKTEKIVGGTVAWNQYVDTISDSPQVGTITGHRYTYSGEVDRLNVVMAPYNRLNVIIGHKYLYTGIYKKTGVWLYLYNRSTVQTLLNPSTTKESGMFEATISGDSQFYLNIGSTATVDIDILPCLFDLTQMFGSTIADYIYSLEQATTGAGVAWFKALFPKDYYPYNAGQLMSVKTSANMMTGINQWDEEWEVGTIGTDGNNEVSSTRIRSTNYIPVISTNAYYFLNGFDSSTTTVSARFYDLNKNYIGSLDREGHSIKWNTVVQIPENARYFRFVCTAAYGTTYNNNICINFSDPSINGTYVPYKISKTIAATYTLRGIGTAKDTLTVRSDGTGELIRNIGEIDLGTLKWTATSVTGLNNQCFYTNSIDNKKVETINTLCSFYESADVIGRSAVIRKYGANADKLIYSGSSGAVYVIDSQYSDATTFKSSVSGVIFYYELITPIVTQLTLEEVAAILNDAISYDVNTSIVASNDSNIDQQFAITIAQEADPVLNNNSWEFISAASTSGNAKSYWSVGDTKEIKLLGTCGTLDLNTTVNVFILGFDHNWKLEGKGITFGGFKLSDGTDIALMDSHYNVRSSDGSKWFNMNHWGNRSYGGWKGSDLRYDILGSTDVAPSGYGSTPDVSKVGYDATSTCAIKPVANTLMSCLPFDLRNVMKPIVKYTDNVGSSSTSKLNITLSIDYLPLLAEYEIFGTNSYANEYEYEKQAQYDYYLAGNTTRKKSLVDSVASPVNWWERSPSFHETYYEFCLVYNSGVKFYDYTDYSRALAPIFLV